jgi:NAD(P)-dependent dehydrogenase (short-subunit alcohol dehydrogenase family)
MVFFPTPARGDRFDCQGAIAGLCQHIYGRLQNCLMHVEGPIELIPLAEVRKQFEVNVIGQIAVTQALRASPVGDIRLHR